jgi:Flp pilus assembly protein TadD
VAVLEGGLALVPGSIELRMELGFVHFKRNDRKKARAMMLQALEAAPGRPDILAALAKMMAMDGEYADAADH